jgi:basic membrane protein A
MSKKVPEAALTSPMFVWGPYYINVVKQVLDGTWTTNQYWGGWVDGVVELAPIGAMVSEEIKTQVLAEADKFKSGEQTIFTIFTGPLKDQTGAEKVATGVAMTGEELLSINWFVEGVIGEIPSS